MKVVEKQITLSGKQRNTNNFKYMRRKAKNYAGKQQDIDFQVNISR